MTARPSLFDKTEANERKLAQMRDSAMEGEVRKYIKAEAKIKFREMLEEEARAAGTSLAELAAPPYVPPSRAEIAVAAIAVVVDIPRMLLQLFAYGVVITLVGTVIYGAIFGIK